jgi:hypothetical protein
MIDFIASEHALPVIFLKYLIDEVEMRDHDILALNPSQCNNNNLYFGFLVLA